MVSENDLPPGWAARPLYDAWGAVGLCRAVLTGSLRVAFKFVDRHVWCQGWKADREHPFFHGEGR